MANASNPNATRYKGNDIDVDGDGRVGKADHASNASNADSLGGTDPEGFVAETDHDKALHDALGIDAATLGGTGPSGFVTDAAHDKALHDALGIDAASVGGKTPSELAGRAIAPGPSDVSINWHERLAFDGNTYAQNNASSFTKVAEITADTSGLPFIELKSEGYGHSSFSGGKVEWRHPSIGRVWVHNGNKGSWSNNSTSIDLRDKPDLRGTVTFEIRLRNDYDGGQKQRVRNLRIRRPQLMGDL